MLLLGWAVSGCGLVKMPFRVAGSVASHSYQAGKRVVKRASEAKPSPSPAAPAKTGEKAKAAQTETSPAGPEEPLPLPPVDPNVPVPPVDLPEMPGDILPPPPEDLPPL